MKRVSIGVFLIVSVGELVSITAGLEFFHMIFKPLIMVSLGAYYWSTAHSRDRSSIVMMAISYSFLGDTLLLFGDLAETYFMLGLASFLLAHLFYVVAYRHHRMKATTGGLSRIHHFFLASPIVLAGAWLVMILYPLLGPLKVPVVLYTIVILLMVVNALLRYGRTSLMSFWLVFVGALLFMLSDSILAVNKFHTEIPHAGILVMTPYIVSQFLIIKGFLAHYSSD